MHLKAGNSITVVTSSGADVDVSVSYDDEGSAKALSGVKNTAITTATTTTILEGPTAAVTGLTRVVRHLSIRNIDSSSNDVTVKLTTAPPTWRCARRRWARGTRSTSTATGAGPW